MIKITNITLYNSTRNQNDGALIGFSDWAAHQYILSFKKSHMFKDHTQCGLPRNASYHGKF
jgi:hypothetical protein